MPDRTSGAHYSLAGNLSPAQPGRKDRPALRQQAEAAGHVGDLRGALASVNAIEQHRTTLLHQVVHDLKGDVLGVNLAATLLDQPAMPEAARAESTTYLKQAVSGLNTMLEELMQLARLQAGQETRKISPFDAVALLTELRAAHQPFALERQLFLVFSGYAPIRPVQTQVLSGSVLDALVGFITRPAALAVTSITRAAPPIRPACISQNWTPLIRSSRPPSQPTRLLHMKRCR